MGLPVKTVASGGLPVVETTRGSPVTEVSGNFGVPVTKVVGKPGLPVTFETIGVAVPLVPTAWNPADTTANVTLSNGNLTATVTNWPAGWRAVVGKTAGKFYFEIRPTTWGTTNPSNIGLSQTGTTVTANPGTTYVGKDGNITVNGSGVGSSLGARAAGDTIGIAADLTAGLIWYYVAPSGNWNGSGTANPATGVGGISLSTITGPALKPWGSAGWVGDVIIANFGGSAFSGAVPSGFTAGWGT